MKCSIPLLLIIASTLAGCSDQGPKDDVADIKTVFMNYREALTKGDGMKAASLVDSNTLAYFNGMLGLARTADSVEVARLDVMDRVMVLGIRYHSTAEELRNMSAREAIATGATTGMMGGEEMGALGIGNVEVDGRHANAPITLSGFPVPAKFHFNREDDEWKIDITPLFEISRMAFEQMALRRGSSGNEWLMEMLAQEGQRPDNSIWHPPVER